MRFKGSVGYGDGILMKKDRQLAGSRGSGVAILGYGVAKESRSKGLLHIGREKRVSRLEVD